MKKLFTIVITALLTGVMLQAQTAIRNEKMTHDADSVTVVFEVDTDMTDLPSNRKEVIFPYIYNEKDTLYLDVLEVYGKGRFKRERQINAINGDRDWDLGANQIFKENGIYNYTSKIPLKRWMKVANLGIRRQIVGCACENDLADETIAQASLFEEPQVQRRTPDYVLAAIDRKWDLGQDELEVIFKVSKSEIDPTVFENQMTFGKILDAIDKIHRTSYYKIDKLHIAGYASPEGSVAFNKRLGINRAKALIDYILKERPQYRLTEDNFEIHNGEENWVGLRRVLAESDMPQKDEVIRIIDDESLSEERKKSAIKSIDNGRVWNKMLKEIYPHLRSARYLAVYYDSTADNMIDILNETYAMIYEGRYAQAYEKIIEYKDDERTFNIIGVTLMMQQKFEEAEPWFRKAIEAGVEPAQRNMDTLAAEYAWEEQQRREIEEYLKKYE